MCHRDGPTFHSAQLEQSFPEMGSLSWVEMRACNRRIKQIGNRPSSRHVVVWRPTGPTWGPTLKATRPSRDWLCFPFVSFRFVMYSGSQRGAMRNAFPPPRLGGRGDDVAGSPPVQRLVSGGTTIAAVK